MTQAPWFALYVTSERRAVNALCEAGFETFAPTFLQYRRHGHRKALEPVPLLPRYVFARIPPFGFHAALSIEHVAYVLSANGEPRPVPEEPILVLMQLVESGRMDERPPATKARPRIRRAKGLNSLMLWFDAASPQPIAKAA